MFYSSDIYADTVCIYGGLAAADLIGCINDDDYNVIYLLLTVEAHMLPTTEMLIEFNGAHGGYVRQLEINYEGE